MLFILFKGRSTYAPTASTLARDGRPNSSISSPLVQSLLCLVVGVFLLFGGGRQGVDEPFGRGAGDGGAESEWWSVLCWLWGVCRYRLAR